MGRFRLGSDLIAVPGSMGSVEKGVEIMEVVPVTIM